MGDKVLPFIPRVCAMCHNKWADEETWGLGDDGEVEAPHVYRVRVDLTGHTDPEEDLKSGDLICQSCYECRLGDLEEGAPLMAKDTGLSIERVRAIFTSWFERLF